VNGIGGLSILRGSGVSAVGKILVAVAAIAAIVALNYFAPGIGTYLSTQLGFTVSAFLVTTVGSIIIAAGFALLNQVLFKPQSPSAEASKVTVRISEPARWLCGGRALQGGGVVFGEYDALGNFWFVQIHADSIMKGVPAYYADNKPVTVDASGWITDNDFCLNSKGDPFNGSGTRVPYFRIWTTTHSETNPIPPGIAALSAALPQWTQAGHLLVGTTYSVIMCKSVKIENRFKVYKWKGPIGLGEPSIAVLADWSNMYDPRDPTQVLGDRSTYKPSRNSAIVWAWFRTHPFGRRKSESEINWSRIAEQADICDQQIVGAYSTQKRYECGAAIIDSKQRAIAEQEIMITCDGQLVFDDDGRTWLRVGYYYQPTLTFSRNRDIVAMESVEAQNGESESQGVIVKYLEPDNGYSGLQSAPWYNPLYYTPGIGATFLTVEALFVQNHNQAMRLAKSIGMRSQPAHKLGPTTGLRGLRAMQERIVMFRYDNVFDGAYELCTPVEVDASGVFCSLGIVPIAPDRFRLLPGEEKPKPVADGISDGSIYMPPTGITLEYNNGRIEAYFAAADRDDVTFQFQYVPTSQVDADQWSDMTTDMTREFAYSGAVDSSVPQSVRYRTVSSGGKVSDWSPVDTIGAVASDSDQAAIYNSFIVEVANGQNVLMINATGTLTITDHTRRYPTIAKPDVAVTGTTINTGLAAGTSRAVAYDDPTLAGGAVTYALYDSDTLAHVSAANPARHYVGYFSVPTTGEAGGGGGGIPGGGGGNCVTCDTPIRLASADRDGPGMERVAGDLSVGDWLWTQHEVTMQPGAYQVEAIAFVEEDILHADGYPLATAPHRFWINGEWVAMATIGEPIGRAMVARITVSEAHTYVSAGVLSHNIKQEQVNQS
jgi:hypothetical protein